MDKLTMFIFIIAVLFAIYPFAVSLRLKGIGAKKCNDNCSCERLMPSFWTKIKGNKTLTRQSMLTKLTLNNDCIALKLLWGPQMCIELKEIERIERMIHAGKTTGIKFLPRSGSYVREFTIEGMVDPSTFVSHLESRSIKCTDTLVGRKFFDV